MKIMNKLSVIIFSLIIASCSSTPKIAGIDRPDYEPYEVSKTKPTINGKYIECALRDSGDIRSFHVGNGKVTRIRSTWGNAELREGNYNRWRTIDFIKEDEQVFEIGASNIKNLSKLNTRGEKCGIGTDGVLNLVEEKFKIYRRDGMFVERRYEASSTEKDSWEKIGNGGECKLYVDTISFGSCRFYDADPDIKAFMEPYINRL
tara:strand:- start:563 stop:1174 length:612 start_codon:yes stop_codon:yes gene_type:complete